MSSHDDQPVEIVIDGTLDLHHFSPKDLKSLIPDYIDECAARRIYEIRIVHGKGKGILRRTVHSILAGLPSVKAFHLAPQERGSWGATIVIIEVKEQG